jgi:HSP20 family protein
MLYRTNDLFSDLFFQPFFKSYEEANHFVKQDDKKISLFLEVPGFEESEISIDIRNKILEIKAEHKENKDNAFINKQIHKRWSLPRSIDEDKIEAKLKNGVLTVDIPIKEVEEKTSKIKILKG